MKFKHKSGRVIEAKNAYEESILQNNPNYKEIKENDTKCIENEKNVVKNEKKSQKTTKKVANEPS